MELPRYPPRMTIEEFLAWDSEDQFKYELHDGVPVLKHRDWQSLGRASQPHQRLVTELVYFVRSHVRPPCKVLTDMQVPNRRSISYYLADVGVACDERDPANGMTFEYPALLIEVVSKSSEEIDHAEKLHAYIALGAEYVTVDSRKREVRIMAPNAKNAWHTEIVTSGAIRLAAIDLTIDVDALYAGIVEA